MITDKNGKTVFAFVKYSELEHLQSLQKGQLYCNSLQFYARYDESNGIGDRFENVYKIDLGTGATFDFTKEHHNISVTMTRLLDGKFLNVYRNDDFFANYFCLYSVLGDTDFERQKNVLLSTEMRQYKHLLLILHPVEFLNRVHTALQKANVSKPVSDFITYTDINTKIGSKSYFEKPVEYSYQNEYRIGFLNTVDEPQIIDIGDIHDISRLHTIDEIKSLTFYKDREELADRLQGIRERLFKEYNGKSFQYEALKNELNNKTDNESIIRLESLRQEVLVLQDRYFDFIKGLL